MQMMAETSFGLGPISLLPHRSSASIRTEMESRIAPLQVKFKEEAIAAEIERAEAERMGREKERRLQEQISANLAIIEALEQLERTRSTRHRSKRRHPTSPQSDKAPQGDGATYKPRMEDAYSCSEMGTGGLLTGTSTQLISSVRVPSRSSTNSNVQEGSSCVSGPSSLVRTHVALLNTPSCADSLRILGINTGTTRKSSPTFRSTTRERELKNAALQEEAKYQRELDAKDQEIAWLKEQIRKKGEKEQLQAEARPSLETSDQYEPLQGSRQSVIMVQSPQASMADGTDPRLPATPDPVSVDPNFESHDLPNQVQDQCSENLPHDRLAIGDQELPDVAPVGSAEDVAKGSCSSDADPAIQEESSILNDAGIQRSDVAGQEDNSPPTSEIYNCVKDVTLEVEEEGKVNEGAEEGETWLSTEDNILPEDSASDAASSQLNNAPPLSMSEQPKQAEKFDDGDDGYISESRACEDELPVEEDEAFTFSLYPREWKKQDHYGVLGLGKLRIQATGNMIKNAYEAKALKHHPVKRRKIGNVVKDDDYFTCISKAYEILGNPVKRRSYDSVDPEFEDTIPPNCANPKHNFYEVFRPVFELNARWSVKKPVCKLGDESSTYEEVDRFYSFWRDFETWREYSYLDEEEEEKGKNREERQWIEKQNKVARQERKKEEMARIRQLTDNAYACDPRVQRFKEEEKEKKLAQKRHRQEAARAKADEEERIRQEALEEEQKKKDAEEEAARIASAAAKTDKDALRKALKKEKKIFRTTVKDCNYYATNDSECLNHLQEVEKLAELLSVTSLQSLEEELIPGDQEQAKKAFLQQLKELKERMEKEGTQQLEALHLATAQAKQVKRVLQVMEISLQQARVFKEVVERVDSND